jgi:hypothetical protein
LLIAQFKLKHQATIFTHCNRSKSRHDYSSILNLNDRASEQDQALLVTRKIPAPQSSP